MGLVVPYRTLWADTERAEEKTELGDQFGEILLKAYREEAYVDPKAFLSGLSEGELETVQHVHWLADPIKVGSLTEEGALNLLMPPAAQVDLNHDSFTQSGAAYGFRFPDSTAPPEVVAAWDEATADLSPSDRMMYEFQMKLPVLIANIVLHPDGTFSHQREPGDPDYQNPMASATYSYVDAVQNRIDYLEDFKNDIDPVRFEKDMSFWCEFRRTLGEQGAA